MRRKLQLIVLLLAASLVLPGAVHAQLFRAYLSRSGSDSNACTIAAPCRLLPAALAAVADGGEVWILDSANYNTGTVTIGKNVSVLAIPGQVGSFVAQGGTDAIAISAPVNVSLRNLSVANNPLSTGGAGLRISAAATVVVDHCVFANLFGPAIDAAAGSFAHVRDSVVRDSHTWGLMVEGGAGANVERSSILNNGSHGILVNASAGQLATASITDSQLSGNGNLTVPGAAVTAVGNGTNGIARVYVTRSTISRNNFALYATTSLNGIAQISVTGSAVTENAHAFVQTGGFVLTGGNNHFADNGSSSGTLVSVALR